MLLNDILDFRAIPSATNVARIAPPSTEATMVKVASKNMPIVISDRHSTSICRVFDEDSHFADANIKLP